jgi:hypothetical protein
MEKTVYRLEDLQQLVNAMPDVITLDLPLREGMSNPAVMRAVNEDDKPAGEAFFDTWCVQTGTLRAQLLGIDCDNLESVTRRAIFDAVAFGKQLGMAKAEKLQTQLLAMQQQARIDSVLPTCIAVAMEATMMDELTIHTSEIATLWDRVVLHSDTQDDTTTYHLVEREKKNGD